MSNGQNSPYGLNVVSSAIGNGGTQKLKGYRIFPGIHAANTIPAMSIFTGDPVKFIPILGGQTIASTLSFGTVTGAYVPSAAIPPAPSTAADPIDGSFLGIFQYCEYVNAQTNVLTTSNYWPSATIVATNTIPIAYINDDPEVVFEVQISTSNNGASVGITGLVDPVIFVSNFIGQNANLQVGGVPFTAGVSAVASANPINGNLTTGQSAYYLDGSSINVANGNGGNPGFDVKIIGIASDVTLASTNIGTVPGLTMPFISLLCKFNNHIYGSNGVPGPFIG